MDKLINKCRRLLALVNTNVVRELMQQINWDQRLISIRGARGVGKTTLMLQYLKLNGCDCKRSLYISMDSVYFATHTLLEFVERFYQLGGKQLLIDEVHKYPSWSREIKEIYDSYPDLRVVVSGSSLLNILNADADLSRRCIPYEMQGLSYREYLWMVKGIHLPAITLKELLSDPNGFCDNINSQCRPLAYFKEYLQEGYYPFILEGKMEYHLRIENVVNFILDVELPQSCGVEIGNIRKMKSLLAVLASKVPMQVDMTKIAAASGVSRNTLLAYMQYLSRARLLNLLYAGDDSVKKMQKPDKIYLENPNLIETLALDEPNIGTVRETFLVGQLCYQHKVEYTKTGELLVDRLYTIKIGGKSKDGKQIASLEDAYIASDDIEYAAGNKIPLWAFGFLY